MTDSYIEYRKVENIKPIELSNKLKFYLDLKNIEDSWSGRINITNSNTFIMESVQLLVNAIELFESGYFDCAYYSIREAIEISTIIVYLTDMPHDDQEKKLENWKTTKDFPMQNQMLKQLTKNGNLFSDMKEKMPRFFESITTISKDINKYVHKQGFHHFYVSRNHNINGNKSNDIFIKNFVYYLKKCIGIVAVMRLAIDPFPILLMDEEILLRCFDSMTEPYKVDFVDEYIGSNTIDKYKQTEIYQSVFDSFIDKEKKNYPTFNVLKHQFIDTNKMDDILSQIHLLHGWDICAVLLTCSCEKIVKVYCCGGLQQYFTSRKSNRTEFSFSSADFDTFARNKIKFNQEYGNAFISVFPIKDETYYIEHNDKLSDEETRNIQDTANKIENVVDTESVDSFLQ